MVSRLNDIFVVSISFHFFFFFLISVLAIFLISILSYIV